MTLYEFGYLGISCPGVDAPNGFLGEGSEGRNVFDQYPLTFGVSLLSLPRKFSSWKVS